MKISSIAIHTFALVAACSPGQAARRRRQEKRMTAVQVACTASTKALYSGCGAYVLQVQKPCTAVVACVVSQ